MAEPTTFLGNCSRCGKSIAEHSPSLHCPPARPSLPAKSREYQLRAMASNYVTGHRWDRCDSEVATLAADEIAALRALFAERRLELIFPTTHRHIKRGTFYAEVGRGTLQTAHLLEDGRELVCYVGIDDGRIWFRPGDEFDDSARFEAIR